MTGKTKKQILQELEESQKRIQELQQEADRLKNYSFIHESDQKLIHNLRLQAEGHKYAINLLREKNIQLKKEASELQAQISAKNEEEVNQFIEQIKAERDDCITECFHGSGISGALCFSIYQCTPGGVCIIILPAFISVAAVAAEIIICSQYPVIV